MHDPRRSLAAVLLAGLVSGMMLACRSPLPTAPTIPDSMPGTIIPAPSITARVRGIVFDERGRGIAGAMVTLFVTTDTRYEALTDDNGVYAMDALLPASAGFFVWAVKDGYEPDQQRSSVDDFIARNLLEWHFRLRDVVRIGASETRILDITAQDSLLGFDLGQEFRVRTVRVVPARDGVLDVDAEPASPADRAFISVDEYPPCCPRHLTIMATGGREVVLRVLIPDTWPGAQVRLTTMLRSP